MDYNTTIGCIECSSWLDKKVYYYSIDNFGAPLCRHHQEWIRSIETTPFTVDLYVELRKRGVPAKLEKFDGYKTIDIAIPECKVNIEIDGQHHNVNPEQALSDLQRTYHSFLKGYITLRIPNSLVKWDLQNTVEYVTKFLNASNQRQWKKQW